MKDLIKEFKRAITTEPHKTSPYDATAEVVRISGNTAWCHISGGTDETPVKLTINAKVGDLVQVRVGGGKAWITGNASAPPTDDVAAMQAQSMAKNAEVMAADAETSADRAREAADNATAYATEARAKAEEVSGIAAAAETYATDAYTYAGLASGYAEDAQLSADKARGELNQVVDVVDVLNWISKHGEYDRTQDSEIVPGKWYFELDSQGNYIQKEPIQNPASEGLYELISVDQAVSNYIETYLSYTPSGGLYLQTANSGGARIQILGDAVNIRDANDKVIATYAGDVMLGNEEEAHVILSSGELGFYQGTDKVAYINDNKLYIKNSELTNSLRIGPFLWSVRGANRISLKYSPEEQE